MPSIKDKVAIVGIGATEFSTKAERTELSLAVEAMKTAVEDCGLEMEEIDGLVKDVDDGFDPSYVQKCLGIDNLLYASESHWGGESGLVSRTATRVGSGTNPHRVSPI